MIPCPHCDAITDVIDSRWVVSKGAVRRRRECPNGHRVTSYERLKLPRGRPYRMGSDMDVRRALSSLQQMLSNGKGPEGD